ncbi:MAG: L,D-transpeptidase family protein [Gammaproteobacteria bacterium]|nr:L,D-transpeptidase family protein [Gammaproteobacteria bacterium]
MFVPARTSVLIVLTLWLLPWAESAGSGPVESEGDVAVTRLIAQWMAIGDDDLQAFYAARAMRPAWRDANVVAALAAAIATLDDDGLVPGDYHPETLLGAYHDAHAAQPRADALARFDIELSRLLITVLHHLASGKVDPAAIDPGWDLPRTAPLLDFAVVSQAVDARQFETVFATARPGHALYAGLRTGLARYRDLERRGGWGTLPARRTALHPGDRHADVPLLRARLALVEDVAEPPPDTCADPAAATPMPDPNCYDDGLAAAVRRFQRHHLLKADGVVGANTRAALNVPVAARIDQIRINLERARWLLSGLPESFVLVDVPGYQLSYFRPGGDIWRARIVVGRPTRPTPTLRSAITHLTFNPTWTVPPTILREDVLPKVRKDAGYLAQENIAVLDASGARLDPRGIDWSRPGNLILRQAAGPHNALGRVAIRFPNTHTVYLHDTPAQELFEFDRRALSSGCVRVEHALEFVRLLLDDETRWNADAIAAVVAAGSTREVDLARRVPLILYYWTVQTDADGALSFRPDLYRRDAALLAALERPPGQR